ncbi:glycosyltransferase family 2 protein [Nodosilinea sp. E11]|uniref:glycosyltransferase family 2 protein n=1 Tax=Nodosilinea sp. E11 TaxID=3037479 RepID=UPI0029343DEA|nr:glycosyltransferase [Nodosilinea sp. E11]WOD39249.1 glycosyltransferase [Nodosilinea sp. E11]
MPNFLPWKILHLDLSNPLVALPADNHLQGYYIVFWQNTIPLGKCQVPADELPLSAAQVMQRAIGAITPMVNHYLAENIEVSSSPLIIEKALASLVQKIEGSDRTPQIQDAVAQTSVVICTRDRPTQLLECLKSLQNLSPAPKEILVIDNAPTSTATQTLVQQFPDVHYVLEPQPGLSVARNTGIQNSTGQFIAFTDDDVNVHPQWLIRLHRAFVDPETLAVTGLIIPAALETEAQVIFELGQGCLSGEYQPQVFGSAFFTTYRRHGMPVWKIGAGANMIFRRKAFEHLGLFDTRLGAGASGCSEDSEFWYRVVAAGGNCRYEPTAVVYHHHRQDLARLHHQMHQYMRGHITALIVQFFKYYHWGNLYRLLFDLPKHYLGLGLGIVLKGKSPKHRTYWAEVSGCLSGINYYLRHKNLEAFDFNLVNQSFRPNDNIASHKQSTEII